MPLHYDGEIKLVKVSNMGSYANNGYIISSPRTGECIIIDTPAEPDRLLDELGAGSVKAILITHGHHDHLEGFAEIKAKTGAPVGVHAGDVPLLPEPPDFLLNDEDIIKAGDVELRTLHTPGHTPGATCFLTGNHVFTGDTLFPGGPGRTRSPQALSQIIASITSKLLSLPNDVNVYPGHGSDTTIGNAREEYRIFFTKPHPADLFGDVAWLEG